MASRKWNDINGFERGAKGIDGKKGENFVDSQRDRKAESRQLGKGYWSGSDNGAWGKDLAGGANDK